jgi:glycerophosphoryl diester phosphodiesterase
MKGGEMWIWDNPSLPVVWRMKNNPLEINWQVEVK